MTTTNITNVTEASWSSNNPNELDYLRPNAFKFQIHNIPNVSYFCQAANIPEMNLPPAVMATPLVDIPFAGDKIDFGTLMIRFLIQEDMKNYKELYDWVVGLGFPESHDQYSTFGKSQEYRFPDISPTKQKALGQHSDASLFLLDSNNNPISQIIFRDAFPVSLQGLDFEISTGQTDYMVGVAMFRYKDYVIETTNQPVSFTPTNTGPVITSSAFFWAAENQTAIGKITATDAENNTLAYTVTGTDAGALTLHSTTGVLTFTSAPNFETKSSYKATVNVSDGTFTSKQDITITVTDVAE
jgi:hypothetical protein|tara:strand:- start:1222 stop:2118 length:897 start_codon:yes stop_codon:yes gene_type:complete